MLFNDSQKIDAHIYPFNWGVDYLDGTYLKEYDDETLEKNDFYTIQTKPIDKFGLYGYGMKFFYQQDGSFLLNGQLIQIEYHVNDTVYHLTSSFDNKDCITYKQAYSEYRGNGKQSDGIESIDFGYKTLIEKDDVQFYFQPIVVIPMSGKVYIKVKLTSNKDLDGKMVFKNKQKVVDEFSAPLKKNYSGMIDWTVK